MYDLLQLTPIAIEKRETDVTQNEIPTKETVRNDTSVLDENVPHSMTNVNAAAQENSDNNRLQELNALIEKWYGSGAEEAVAARQAEKKTVREQLQEGKKKTDALDAMKGELDREKVSAIDETTTEDERYELLKDRVLVVPNASSFAEYGEEIQSLEQMGKKATSKAKDVIIPLVEALGILNVEKGTPEIEFGFQFSKNKGLKESLEKQRRYGGSYADFAKALLHMDEVLKNAVLIERHTDKYKGTERENRNLEHVSVLFGAFADGDAIIPVQMTIKKLSDAGGRLYVNVALTKIEAGVIGSASSQNDNAHSLIPTSTYRIADIFKQINTEDRHFLKYLPDRFLDSEQRRAKKDALKKDEQRIGQMKDRATEDRGLHLIVRNRWTDGLL